MGAVGGFWSVPVPVSSCNSEGWLKRLEAFSQKLGPCSHFSPELQLHVRWIWRLPGPRFLSKGVELERIIKGSCRVTFSLGMDEEYKLSFENCLTLEAGGRSGVMCCWWAAVIFSPGLFATDNTGPYPRGFFSAGSVCALMGPGLSRLVSDTSGLCIYLCCAFMWGAGGAGCCRFTLLWCCSLSDCGIKLFPEQKTGTKPVLHSSWESNPLTHALKTFGPLHKHLDGIKPRT